MSFQIEKNQRVIQLGELQRQIRESDDHRKLYANNEFCSKFANQIEEIVREKRIKVLSFDVFDTVLLRPPRSELGRFYDISVQFSKRSKCDENEALLARLFAARGAYQIGTVAGDGTREGDYSSISRTTCEILNKKSDVVAYRNVEFSYEKSTLTPNPLVSKILKNHPKLQVVFLSDMYFDSVQIQKLSEKHYGLRPKIFSSAEGYGSKRLGGLYHHVSKTCGYAPNDFLHLGDNFHSDFQQALRAGWASFHLPLPNSEITQRKMCYQQLLSDLKIRGIDLEDFTAFSL
jgi:FMN phosphatase YigB (HAD superfamily)